jgi:hypothetical protein
MTPFEEAARVAFAALVSWHGEPTRIEPRRTGKYSTGAPDPGRQARDLVGVVRIRSEVQRSDGDAIGANFGFPMAVSPVTIRYAWDQFADSPLPRKDDRIHVPARPGNSAFEVARVDASNPGCLVLHCTVAGEGA